MKNIYNYSIEDLENYFLTINEKKFRATQVYEWLYKMRINNFDEIKNMKQDVKEKLKEDFNLDKLTIVSKVQGQDVYKYLFKLHDGNTIEAVLMKQSYGNFVCFYPSRL